MGRKLFVNGGEGEANVRQLTNLRSSNIPQGRHAVMRNRFEETIFKYDPSTTPRNVFRSQDWWIFRGPSPRFRHDNQFSPEILKKCFLWNFNYLLIIESRKFEDQKSVTKITERTYKHSFIKKVRI